MAIALTLFTHQRMKDLLRKCVLGLTIGGESKWVLVRTNKYSGQLASTNEASWGEYWWIAKEEGGWYPKGFRILEEKAFRRKICCRFYNFKFITNIDSLMEVPLRWVAFYGGMHHTGERQSQGGTLRCFFQTGGRRYLCPLQVHGVHEGALKVLDPRVLTLQQTLKFQVWLGPWEISVIHCLSTFQQTLKLKLQRKKTAEQNQIFRHNC